MKFILIQNAYDKKSLSLNKNQINLSHVLPGHTTNHTPSNLKYSQKNKNS